jgi:hypothetical protein
MTFSFGGGEAASPLQWQRRAVLSTGRGAPAMR